MKAEYERAGKEWGRFADQRLNERRLRLRSELKQRIAGGRKWTFVGDKDFAGFLFEKDPGALTGALVTDQISDLVDPVIVSRHDKELLWRRLKRENSAAAARALRLYG